MKKRAFGPNIGLPELSQQKAKALPKQGLCEDAAG
jgi:hypothetical protein